MEKCWSPMWMAYLESAGIHFGIVIIKMEDKYFEHLKWIPTS